MEPAARLAGWARLASFVLGVAVIVDALAGSAPAIQWVAGLILVGIVPPEAVASAWRKANGRRP